MFVLIVACLLELLAALPMFIIISLNGPNWTIVQTSIYSWLFQRPEGMSLLLSSDQGIVSIDVSFHTSEPFAEK